MVAVEVLPDDQAMIEVRLRHHADTGCDLVFTTGGTGFTPDDVTPEATRAVIDRDAPGFAEATAEVVERPTPGLDEAMREVSRRASPHGLLSRGASGITGRTLIVNFPGSPKAVRESFPVVAPTLRHVVETLRSSGGSRSSH